MEQTTSMRYVFKNILVFLLIFVFFSQQVMAQSTLLRGTNSTEVSEDSVGQQKVKTLESNGEDIRGQRETSDIGFTDSQLQHIPTIQVQITGDVAVPGAHRVKLSTRVLEEIMAAQPNRSNLRLYQIRRSGQKTQTYDLYKYYYQGDLSQNPYLSDGDVVFIPKQKGTIRVEGSVYRPGFYELVTEKNLLQAVALAGGFSSVLAKTFPIRVIRFDENGHQNVLEVQQTELDLKKFSIWDGDIIVVPDIINATKKFDYSVETIPGGNMVYPTSVAEVFVIGSVENPGPYPYKSHLTAKDYVGFAGANADANVRSVVVFRDGKNKRQKFSSKMQAGDVIIVKEKGFNQFLSALGIASSVLSLTLSTLILRDALK
jgi:protein involved in polysaccharide export with SLBB domain